MKALRAPLPEVVHESEVSIRVVRGLVDAVVQAGVPAARFLQAARIDVAQFDCEDAYVPRSQMYRLCELAVDITQDPAFGLHWAERLSASTFNPISHLVAHSATLRQGFESLLQFHRLLSEHVDFQLTERDDTVTVQCSGLIGESFRVQHFVSEMLVVGLVRILRTFNAHARPRRVSFAYEAPAYHVEYTRVFERAERFEQPFTGIVFDRGLMDTASPHKDGDVHDALQLIAERRMLRLSDRAPISLRVRERLVHQGAAAHHADMQAIARSLGMSARSLRRRLMAEGKSYNALVKEALAIVAKHFLRNKQFTIQETAYEMGFADTSTFHRAFKRWTGMTPASFREQQLGH